MSLATILCDYIYNTFKLLKATLDTYQRAAFSYLNAIDVAVNALGSLIKYSLNAIIDEIVNALKVLYKTIIDMSLPDVTNSHICTNLYKCSFILEEILDPNSLMCRTLKSYGYNTALQSELYSIIKDYDSFKKVICANGFSFDLGISFIKGILTSYLEILNKWLKYFLRKEMHIKRLIQKYLDFCIDTGICDILDKITKYFNCVLMNGIDSCAAISTASSYYKSALNKLCLAEAGNGTYKINSEDSDRWLATIHSTTATLQDSKQNLDDALAVLVSPSSISAASNAYSLNSTIKGIISATKADGRLFKINNLKKIPIVNYIVVKRKALLEAVREQFGLDSDTSDSEIENKTEIDDNSGNVKYNGVIVSVQTDIDSTLSDLTDKSIQIPIDADLRNINQAISFDDNIHSSMWATISCYMYGVNPSNYASLARLYNYCQKCNKTFGQYLLKEDVAVKY